MFFNDSLRYKVGLVYNKRLIINKWIFYSREFTTSYKIKKALLVPRNIR